MFILNKNKNKTDYARGEDKEREIKRRRESLTHVNFSNNTLPAFHNVPIYHFQFT